MCGSLVKHWPGIMGGPSSVFSILYADTGPRFQPQQQVTFVFHPRSTGTTPCAMSLDGLVLVTSMEAPGLSSPQSINPASGVCCATLGARGTQAHVKGGCRTADGAS